MCVCVRVCVCVCARARVCACVCVTVTTTFCIVFGLLIVTVAMCKLDSREPWIVAMNRTVGRGSSVSAPGATPNAAAPDAVAFELVDLPKPAKIVVDLEKGGSSAAESSSESVGFELVDPSKPAKAVGLESGGSSSAESPSETMKRVNAENAFLKRENERLMEDNKLVQKVQHDNKDLKRENEHLRRENEVLRVSSTLNQSGGGGGLEEEAVTPDTIVEKALVEAPATAEDIELQVTTDPQTKSAAVVEVGADALNTMLATGLERQHCVLALRRCDGDPNSATEFCLRPMLWKFSHDKAGHEISLDIAHAFWSKAVPSWQLFTLSAKRNVREVCVCDATQLFT